MADFGANTQYKPKLLLLLFCVFFFVGEVRDGIYLGWHGTGSLQTGCHVGSGGT